MLRVRRQRGPYTATPRRAKFLTSPQVLHVEGLRLPPDAPAAGKDAARVRRFGFMIVFPLLATRSKPVWTPLVTAEDTQIRTSVGLARVGFRQEFEDEQDRFRRNARLWPGQPDPASRAVTGSARRASDLLAQLPQLPSSTVGILLSER